MHILNVYVGIYVYFKSLIICLKYQTIKSSSMHILSLIHPGVFSHTDPITELPVNFEKHC